MSKPLPLRTKAKKPPAGGRTSALRVHFENLPTKPQVFHITKERLAAARRRHADVVKRVKITHGEDVHLLAQNLPSIEVLVTSYDVLSHPAFPLRTLSDVAPRLRWILVTSAGIEKLLPLDWLPAKTSLINARGAHWKKANEFAQMSLLMLNAQVARMVTNQRNSRWESIFTPVISGKRLLVLGTGYLGRAFAKQGKRLGLEVTGISRSGGGAASFDEVRSLKSLRSMLTKADFVVTALPLTKETAGLIGTMEFARMKRGAGFMNVGRGGVIDHAALRQALQNGHLSSAILDVYQAEPLPAADALWDTPNLIMSPHVAMDDIDAFLPTCLDLAFDNIRRTLAAKPLKNVVNPALGY